MEALKIPKDLSCFLPLTSAFQLGLLCDKTIISHITVERSLQSFPLIPTFLHKTTVLNNFPNKRSGLHRYKRSYFLL